MNVLLSTWATGGSPVVLSVESPGLYWWVLLIGLYYWATDSYRDNYFLAGSVYKLTVGTLVDLDFPSHQPLFTLLIWRSLFFIWALVWLNLVWLRMSLSSILLKLTSLWNSHCNSVKSVISIILIVSISISLNYLAFSLFFSPFCHIYRIKNSNTCQLLYQSSLLKFSESQNCIKVGTVITIAHRMLPLNCPDCVIQF